MAADDPRLTWRGALDRIAVPGHRGALRPSRLPVADAALHDDALLRTARLGAGVRIGFCSDSPTVVVRVLGLDDRGRVQPLPFTAADGPARVDVTVAGDRVGGGTIGPDGSVTVDTGATAPTEVEIWLPHRCPIAVDTLTFADGAAVEPSRSRAPIWIAHGSSITQSRFSESPTRSWTSQVARSAGLDLYNLGFAGECHLEPLVARTISEAEADLISICAGINIYTSISMSERTYRANLAGFIRIVRDGHPRTPIVLTSPIASPGREATPNHPRLPPGPVRRLLRSQRHRLPVGTVGPTLAELREATCDVAARLVAAGDEHLHYVDGTQLLSAQDAEHLVDGLHPDQIGEDLIAERYRPLVERWLDRDRTDQSA